MKLVYNIKDKPKFGQLIVFAFQQLLAILAATIAVPSIIGNGMSQSAALFGAGVGTIVYLLFTKFNSPVFLGSSFAFLGSMGAAFAGAISEAAGHAGLIIGAVCAGLVYVVIAIIVKFAGVKWNAASRLRPDTDRMINIIFVKAGSLDFFHREVLCQLVDDGCNNLQMSEFFRSDIRQSCLTLFVWHSIPLGQITHGCAHFPVRTAIL